MKKIENIQLMKLLTDPRRTRILQLTEKKPMNIKEMAKELNEKPSRLYYHVQKLEEAGLIQCVMTKEHGNLTEKYYQCVDKGKVFRCDSGFLSDNFPFVNSYLQQLIEQALYLLQLRASQQSEKEQKDLPQVMISISHHYTTTSDWKKRFGEAVGILSNLDPAEMEEKEEKNTKPEKEISGTYQTIVISFRAEDAEKFGMGK